MLTAAHKSSRAPNVIVIVTDDQGYADLSCFGSKTVHTPHLDRMAREGLRCTDFYSMPICGPARAALMTGCYPLRLAERDNVKQNMPVLHPEEQTMATLLRQRGYATGMFGKWDLAGHKQRPEYGLQMDLLPTHHGFDEFFGTPASNDCWANTTLIEGDQIIESPIDLSRGTTERFTDRLLHFIDRHSAQPFFASLATNMPHVELHTSPEFVGASGRGPYEDAIVEIDHHVGRVFAHLHKHNLHNDTIVLFMSDNGPWLSKGVLGGCAEPLRSGKLSTWEGGPRVPAIFWGPTYVAAGATCHGILRSIDVLPTILSYSDGPPPRHQIDGCDVSAVLAQPDLQHPVNQYAYYFRTHLQAIRSGPWKLIVQRPLELPWIKGCSPNKHIHAKDDIAIPTPQLFHLPTDIGERHNLAGEHVHLVDDLLQQAECIRQDVGDYNLCGKGARFFDQGEQRPQNEPGGVWAEDECSLEALDLA